MEKFFLTTVKVLFIVFLCINFLISCNDDDDDDNSSILGSIASADASYGFMANSTSYSLVIDLGEKEEFEITLEPGAIVEMKLQENKTYVIHVVVMNTAGRALSEYINSFFIDDIPLDNQLSDFVCSWYVEFTSNQPLSGFANEFGT